MYKIFGNLRHIVQKGLQTCSNSHSQRCAGEIETLPLQSELRHPLLLVRN